MSSINFIPAADAQRQWGGKEHDPRLTWWEDESIVQYPAILISAFKGIEYPDFRERFGIKKSTLFIGDSGGFTVMTKGENIFPREILNWEEDNCDVGFILDCPILPTDSKFECIKKQEITVRYATEMTKERQKDKFKLYSVYHGRSLVEMENIHKLYDGLLFEGAGIGSLVPVASNTPKISEIILSFLEVTDYRKNIHIFGLSGLNTIPLLHYIKQKYEIENLTYDSSSFMMGGRLRSYFLLGLKIDLSLSTDINNRTKMGSLPCICPVCKTFTLEEMCSEGTKGGNIINLHNLYEYIRFDTLMKGLSTNEDLLKQYIKRHCSEGVNRSVEYIDYAFERGFTKATEKYINGAQTLTRW